MIIDAVQHDPSQILTKCKNPTPKPVHIAQKIRRINVNPFSDTKNNLTHFKKKVMIPKKRSNGTQMTYTQWINRNINRHLHGTSLKEI